MKCLETRQRNGMKWRRYRAPDGSTHQTYEVPVAVVGVLGVKRLREELQRAARRQAIRQRNARIRRLLAEGWKPLAIAAEVGLSEAMVRRLRQKFEKEAR